MKNKGQLIVYSGPSGVGKGTVLTEAIKRRGDIIRSVSATTRSPREGEIEGVDYFFVTKEEFNRKAENGELLEFAEYNSQCYGTPSCFVRENLENGKNVVLEIEVQGALRIRELMPSAVLIFLMPPNFETLKLRLTGRKTESEEQIVKRLTAAATEIEKAHLYDFIVINDELEAAVGDFLACVDSAPHLVRLNGDFVNRTQEDAKEFSHTVDMVTKCLNL
ncbi:MAG: guanylate kinase [Oscillospiraceae bacterium]